MTRGKKENNKNETYNSISQRILSFLEREPNRLWTVVEIHDAVKGKLPVVRTTLSRLTTDGKILRVRRGIYRLNKCPEFPPPFEGSPLMFHAFHMVKRNVTEEQATLLLQRIKQKEGHPPTTGKSNRIRHVFELGENRHATFWISAHTIEVQIGMSKNPMTSREFDLALKLLDSQYDLELYSAPKSWEVVNVEINQDDRTVSLSGLQSVTLRDLDILIQVYNKRGTGLRKELRLSNITLIDVLAWLGGDRPPGWAKQQHRIEALERTLKDALRMQREERRHLDKVLLEVHELVMKILQAKKGAENE
ncbi:MAG: type IV toxin-antitoxin system AbiEi family antitoxin domain-containing protein [Thermoplasmata archaeon]|nr:MAG: type IV toxin-antitoxin system AbiEi family antitoxin domain-containing protein [Thermoplasmata archaeon]